MTRPRSVGAAILTLAVLTAGCAAPGTGAPGAGAPETSAGGTALTHPAVTPETTASVVEATRAGLVPSASNPNRTPLGSVAATADSKGVASTSVSLASDAARPSGVGAQPGGYGSPQSPIRVQVSGLVLADKSGVLFCPPLPVAGIGSVTLPAEPVTPDCLQGVPVTGMDLTRLADATHNSSHRWGQGHATALWDGSGLQVISQRLPTRADSEVQPNLPDDVGCPDPAGGWKLGDTQNDPGIDKIERAVGSGFGGLAMGYPHGGPTNTDGSNPSYSLEHTEQVVVVGVTGDRAAAVRSIRKVFTGNLCVVHADHTGAEVTGMLNQMAAAVGDHAAKMGIMSFGATQQPLGNPIFSLTVVRETQEVDALLSRLTGPPAVVYPWMKLDPTG